MQKKRVGGLMLALLLLIGVPTASAIPIISIDLDPGTLGIQSTRSVTLGSSFTIDVVFTGDGIAAIDTFLFDTVFNDLGAILGLTGGTGSPTAGSIAGTCPVLCVDALTFGAVVPGSALTTFPALLPPPFTVGSGLVGIASPGFLSPFTGGPIAAGTEIDLFSLTLDALAIGMSTVSPSTGGGLGGLAVGGLPVPFTPASGSVTVTPAGGPGPGIPEPSILMLFVLGLAGLGFSKRRKV